ncbi:MAG: hypothetical protein H0V17_31505, partial [Deltaproteobacteria bacterium]|nr:hypothetical protein [Deltaproteobacteria bacterium]
MGYKTRMREVAMWLVVVGCVGGGEPASEPSAARPAATGPTTIPPAAPPELPAIRLRSPGDEPRRELRYRPVVG